MLPKYQPSYPELLTAQGLFETLPQHHGLVLLGFVAVIVFLVVNGIRAGIQTEGVAEDEPGAEIVVRIEIEVV